MLAGEKEKAAAQSGSHFQDTFGTERTPSVFIEVEILNGGWAFGAVAAFVFVLKKVGVERPVCLPNFAVLLLESEAGSTGAKGSAKAGNLPRLRLTLPPCKKLVLAADLVSEGKNFGTVDLLFHILFAFDYTNILDTLAQTGTPDFENPSQSHQKIVCGQGSDLSDNKAWKGRAKRKLISQALNVGLIEAVEKKGVPERKLNYWNAFHCQSKLLINDGRAHGQYCKTRFCLLCSSIRKAEIINRYLPEIKTWKAPYFVTLTSRSVKASKLNQQVTDYLEGFEKIIGRLRKRHLRGNGIRPVGIKSLECNFNAEKRTYNPHFHLIVESEAVANAIIAEWLTLWPPKHAEPFCQNKQRVRNIEKCLIEVVKYSSKIFTDPDLTKKGALPKQIYAAALDNIFQAMQSHRIFDRFGFNLPPSAKEGTVRVVPASQCEDFIFAVEMYDWLNAKTGVGLAEFAPTAQLDWLIHESIDTDLQ